MQQADAVLVGRIWTLGRAAWTAIASARLWRVCSKDVRWVLLQDPTRQDTKVRWGSYTAREHVYISGCVSAPYSCVDSSNDMPAAVRAALAEIVSECARWEKPRATRLHKWGSVWDMRRLGGDLVESVTRSRMQPV